MQSRCLPKGMGCTRKVGVSHFTMAFAGKACSDGTCEASLYLATGCMHGPLGTSNSDCLPAHGKWPRPLIPAEICRRLPILRFTPKITRPDRRTKRRFNATEDPL